MYKRYVLGFLFDNNMEFVALIKKIRPEWQRGLFNGIGGKIEPGETPDEAMIREFIEEAGVRYTDWTLFATLAGNDNEIYCYYGVSEDIWDVETTEEERVEVVNISLIDNYKILPNLKWLIPAAMMNNGERIYARYPSLR